MIRQAFTLIELLVVVAIIGILAAVGTPIFQGFLLDAKINSSRENHIRMRDYIATSFTKCAGSPDGKIQLGAKKHRCDGNTYSMARDFYDYFRGGRACHSGWRHDDGAAKIRASRTGLSFGYG